MALRYGTESPKKAYPGEILLVIHDFEARSSDELTLSKGDRLELIERDDDFGDGWYLGRHMLTGMTGLFPEVYTTTAPKGLSAFRTGLTPTPSTSTQIKDATTSLGTPSIDQEGSTTSATPSLTPQSSYNAGSTDHFSSSAAAAPAPLNPSQSTQPPVALANPVIHSSPTPIGSAAQRSIGATMQNQHLHGQESPVMNETLSVIDEHITDLSTPRQGVNAALRRRAADSENDYGARIDHRLSYIAGHETDEEEENLHTEEEVSLWTPAQVATYLEEMGVEPAHCQVFQEQEISGEVLLSMDQAAIFIKEFDLGPVGRRLRTWNKIKQLQLEAKGSKPARRDSRGPSRDGRSSSIGKDKHGSGAPVLPRIPSLMESAEVRYSRSAGSKDAPLPLQSTTPSAAISPTKFVPAGLSQQGSRRPSAASIREFNNSRRQSSLDYPNSSVHPPLPAPVPANPGLGHAASQPIVPLHRKAPSFDRNWTMGEMSLSAVVNSGRPATATAATHGHTTSTDRNTLSASLGRDSVYSANVPDLDRGYFSGGEAEDRRARNVLKKRDVNGHSRKSSYTDEHRRRSSAGVARYTRFGSTDSGRDTLGPVVSPASKMYYGMPKERRAASAGEAGNTQSTSKAFLPPTVTKLDYDPNMNSTVVTSTSKTESDVSSSGRGSPLPQLKTSASSKLRAFGFRAISDAVTGGEKSFFSSPPGSANSLNESPLRSPSRRDSGTPSGGSKSLEMESADATRNNSTGSGGGTPTSSAGARRRKSKKETSAYMRGLEKKTPREQMVGCDYSGWMKKKSSNLMATWKPRLFVLRGRRLSYYYSEDDQEEKGLIDISFHRVLPADNDRLHGLHATLTGASVTSMSPQKAQLPTNASEEVANDPDLQTVKSANEGLFIFKLVPPRTGLTRAVTFTKPTVHYFAVDNVKQGRLWMAALMKATIERDDSVDITSTYQQKTISLAKAQAMRQRPPALMPAEEKASEQEHTAAAASAEEGLKIHGLQLDSPKADEIKKDENQATVNGSTAASLSSVTHEPVDTKPPSAAEVADGKSRSSAEGQTP
ncbi:hypothetical protein L228DRAFT_266621 [Xylona heveae TC161]|uniref:Polarized growth protein Boi2 n=1 Tax=Xylona heveae (strain CBS 132557 / TC161) TaxID=1328760 RepID=A0A165I2I9_XYLHT|nr:hypothetical protein L228DRAFT_266621 [Xylona heveae TC161]KZF24275.1 hypothetical protein L228DRAFT_266621 [Xylona heveae TC161]